MTRPLKVYSASYSRRGRMIVAATTKKAAYEAMKAAGWGGSYTMWDAYSSETGNSRQIEIATAKPGAVFVCETPRWSDDDVYKEKEPRR